jgi:hypothetical protein
MSQWATFICPLRLFKICIIVLYNLSETAEVKMQQPPRVTTYLLTAKESSTLRRVFTLGVLYPRARVGEKNMQTVSLAIRRKAHNSLAGRFDVC